MTTDVAEPTLFDWQTMSVFLVEAGFNALHIGLLVVGGVVVAWILRLVIGRIVARVVSGAKDRANVDDTQALERSPLSQVRVVQRTRTLGSILQNIVNVTIVLVVLLLTVDLLAPSALGSLTLLTAAVGAGLGFGAQNIVKDVLNGIFIVAEDQVGIGDVVDLGLATGIVEFVSVRATHVRDVNGTLWYVRNGEITRIGNMSQGWARVIIDLTVPADADLKHVEAALLAAADDLAHEPKWRSRVIEKPEVWGLESITGGALVTRVVIKTRANAKDDVARELRMRFKGVVAEMGVGLTKLNSTTLSGIDGAQRVRGANPPTTKPSPLPAAERVPRPMWRLKRTAPDDPAPPGQEGRTP